MNFRNKIVAGMGALMGLASAVDALPEGTLIIVGGALRASNSAVYEAIIDKAALRSGGKLGILPAASSKPSEAAAKFIESLGRYGVSAGSVVVLPLAVMDDSTTPEIDESAWLKNAESSAVAQSIASLSGIWMTGGDQARIMQVLRHEDGSDTQVGSALMDLHKRGGFIGGTSAGAAVQSQVMILGGSSPGALALGSSSEYRSMAEQESGPLILGSGIGLFPHGVIDQYFDRKARLGRLAVALMVNSASERHGFGIDEDTALLLERGLHTATVLGNGSVVWVDARAASQADGSIRNLRIHVLGSGDRLVWPGPQMIVHSAKKPTIGNEFHAQYTPPTGSLFAPYAGRLDSALGSLLLDNSLNRELVVNIPLRDDRSASAVFTQDNLSTGHWGYIDGQWESYSISGVRLDIVLPERTN